MLVFTSEEVWQTRFGANADSVHLLEWPILPLTRHPVLDTGLGLSAAQNSQTPDQVRGDELVEKWEKIRAVRAAILEEIEPRRRDKTIGSSLEAEIHISASVNSELIEGIDWAEICIVSAATVQGGFVNTSAAVNKTTNHKCGRCWRHLPEVTEDGALCERCEDVINA